MVNGVPKGTRSYIAAKTRELKEEKEKKHTACEHGPQFHSEGLCWKITNIELTNEPTNKKYCPCTQEKNLIRTYKRVGYMEAEPHDHMITKSCKVCNTECLFIIDNDVCISCNASSLYKIKSTVSI
jgi:hypothetical protein